jgi:hypothetical protein
VQLIQFIVDGVWRVSPDYETISDGSNVNNAMVPLVLEWTDSGNEVSVHTELDEWKSGMRMTRDPNSGHFVLSEPIRSALRPSLQFKVCFEQFISLHCENCRVSVPMPTFSLFFFVEKIPCCFY